MVLKSTNQDDIFNHIGHFGPWQRNVFIIFYLVNIIGIYQNFAITFMAPNMDYWCASPLPEESIIDESTTELTLSNSINQCEVFLTNKTSVPCTEWEYNTSVHSHTIVNEWDLVCEREWLVSFSKSIYMVGFMMSVLIFGQISDCIGRFPTIIICYIITIVSTITSAFSTSYAMFAALRFFSAFGRTGMTTTAYVLIMEIIGPKLRMELGLAIQTGWTFGFLTLSAIAYFIRPWYWFQLAISVPILPLGCMYWFVPESPRWLMTQGKIDRFVKTITKAAKLNGRKIDDSEIKSLRLQKLNQDEKKTSTKTLLDLLKTPQLRKRTLCMAAIWMVNAFVYYALAYNTNDLGGDPYLNFFCTGVMEFASYVVLFYCVRKLGRKLPLIVGMMVAGGSCACIMLVPQDFHWLIITFAMIGRFCITGTFGLLYLYTTEVFPTVVRNVAIGSCSTNARIGSIIAPFVRELERATHYTVPYAINACLAIAAGVIAFVLPETRDRKIPDTLEEGEVFGQGVDQSKNTKKQCLCCTTGL